MGSIFKSSVTINSVLLVFEGILIINIPPLLEIPSKLSNSNATLTLPWNLRFWLRDEGYEDGGGDRNNSE